jgi:hypothetical protein
MSFGRVLLDYINDRATVINTIDTGVWNKLATLFKKLNVKIDPSIKPRMGWNLKAKWALRLFRLWGCLAEIINCSNEITKVVSEVDLIFHVLFKLEYVTPEEVEQKNWVCTNVNRIVNNFSELIGRNRDLNYLHEVILNFHLKI